MAFTGVSIAHQHAHVSILLNIHINSTNNSGISKLTLNQILIVKLKKLNTEQRYRQMSMPSSWPLFTAASFWHSDVPHFLNYTSFLTVPCSVPSKVLDMPHLQTACTMIRDVARKIPGRDSMRGLHGTRKLPSFPFPGCTAKGIVLGRLWCHPALFAMWSLSMVPPNLHAMAHYRLTGNKNCPI